MFSEKLNFLMNITKAQNSVLANAVVLDASHISRLRHGGRKLPKKQTFLMPMATFFARNLKAEYQKRIMKDTFGISEWPIEEAETSKLIYHWLLSDEDSIGAAGQIIKIFAAPSVKPFIDTSCPAEYTGDKLLYYYGPKGKREAVIRFLSMVLQEKTPQTLLLYSEEEMGWLYEDRAFAAKWAQLLGAVLMRGNRIRIIHTVSRNMNELLEAVNKWVPVYVSGMIEPYYYPKLRDGVFQRTLFIAPKTGAIVSASVKQDVSEMLHFYVTDRTALAALVKDYERYLDLCRPLIQIFTNTDSAKLRMLYYEFERTCGETILMHPGLSLMSMPQEVVLSMSARTAGSLFKELCFSGENAFETCISKCSFTELICLPDEESITADTIPCPLADPICVPKLYYTKGEYRLHLENILYLMEKHKNYNVFLSNNENISNLMLYAKDGIGVLMSKMDSSHTLFAFNEPNMTAAFWDYLVKESEQARRKRTDTITEIKRIISILK